MTYDAFNEKWLCAKNHINPLDNIELENKNETNPSKSIENESYYVAPKKIQYGKPLDWLVLL